MICVVQDGRRQQRLTGDKLEVRRQFGSCGGIGIDLSQDIGRRITHNGGGGKEHNGEELQSYEKRAGRPKNLKALRSKTCRV